MLQIVINRLAKKFIGIVSSEKLRGGGSVSLTFFLIAIHSQDHLHCQRQASETLCSFGQKQSFLARWLERSFPINPCVFHDSLHYMEDKCSKEGRSGFNNIIHYLWEVVCHNRPGRNSWIEAVSAPMSLSSRWWRRARFGKQCRIAFGLRVCGVHSISSLLMTTVATSSPHSSEPHSSDLKWGSSGVK